jgi:hypothetical protein
MMDTVSVIIAPQTDPRVRNRIAYTLTEISARIGICLRIMDEPLSDERPCIYYGTAGTSSALHVLFDMACWDGTGIFHVAGESNKRPLWGNRTTTTVDKVDLLGGVFRLLTLADEVGVPDAQRDRRGIFMSTALPKGRLKQAQSPLVEHLCMELSDRLKSRFPYLPAWRPIWPTSHVVSLTHDTDCLSFSYWQEIVYNSIKAMVRRNPIDARLAVAGLNPLRWGRNNPFCAFETWFRYSEQRALKSAFYLFHRVRARRDVNDCRSTVFSSTVDWALLRRIYDHGHEIGIHPSIHSKDTPGEFEKIKQDVESRLEREVIGVRHHYWAIDWRRPYNTWRDHLRAGYRYDSSIAWRDIPGLRAGTCLPYQAYDFDSEKPLDFIVVPCAVMDGHIMANHDRIKERARIADELLGRIAAVGGVSVLNWHTETACNDFRYKGYIDILSQLIDNVTRRGAPTTMTPAAIAAFWRNRTIQFGAHERAPT